MSTHLWHGLDLCPMHLRPVIAPCNLSIQFCFRKISLFLFGVEIEIDSNSIWKPQTKPNLIFEKSCHSSVSSQHRIFLDSVFRAELVVKSTYVYLLEPSFFSPHLVTLRALLSLFRVCSIDIQSQVVKEVSKCNDEIVGR